MRIIMRGYKNPAMKIDPETILQHNLIGRNSGNLIFSQSAIKALSVPGTEIEIRDLPRRFEAPEVINETFDAMVLPFANAFRRGFLSQLREYTELLKRIKVPVTVLGIGAQSDLNFGTDELDSMKEEIKAFVSAALDRGPTVGVRGEFTREYLNSLGFRDVTTIGCPSMFANGQMLSVDEELDVKRDSRIALNATQNVNHGPGFIQRAAKQYWNLEYFPQMLADLELMIWGDLDSNKEESDYPNSLRHPLYADNRSRFFLDAGAWIEYLKDFSFSVGSRIHGNVAALLAGVPAHVLIHDSRTRELAEYFEIPATRVDRIESDTDIADLRAVSDYSAMVSNHARRFEVFQGYLRNHGLETVYDLPEIPEKAASALAAVNKPVTVEIVEADSILLQRLGAERRRVSRVAKSVRTTKKTLTASVASLESEIEHLRVVAREQSRRIERLERERDRTVVNRFKSKVKRVRTRLFKR